MFTILIGLTFFGFDLLMEKYFRKRPSRSLNEAIKLANASDKTLAIKKANGSGMFTAKHETSLTEARD
ncbi:MAG: hypothetical protein H6605_08295 [Flavobacteriales bacterium]|nr:hypothetical protein [Flavobacteriales bacterium]